MTSTARFPLHLQVIDSQGNVVEQEKIRSREFKKNPAATIFHEDDGDLEIEND